MLLLKFNLLVLKLIFKINIELKQVEEYIQ